MLIRLWVGVGFVVVGLWLAIGGHPQYLPDDPRANPAFWQIIGGIAAVTGAAILVWTVRGWRKTHTSGHDHE
jgi:hypothetical protein